MSFITGTQTELLYAMPASGTAVTAAAATVMSGTTAANPPYQLPTGFFQQQSGGGAGKSMLIKGGGWYTTGSTAVTTVFQIGLNSTAGTGAIALLFGKTGTLTTVASTTDGLFSFEVLVTSTSPGFGSTTSSLNAMGWVGFGNGNNAATGTFGTFGANNLSIFAIGTAQTAVAPVPSTTYFIECSNTWNVTTGAPTITLTNYLIFGLN